MNIESLKKVFDFFIGKYGIASGLMIGLCLVMIVFLLRFKPPKNNQEFIRTCELLLLVVGLILACAYYSVKWGEFAVLEIPIFIICGLVVLVASLLIMKIGGH